MQLRRRSTLLVSCVLLLVSGPAYSSPEGDENHESEAQSTILAQSDATWFRGIFLANGNAAFADRVHSYDVGAIAPDHENIPTDALGLPNDTSTSLGAGGSLVLEFVDNFLRASQSPTPDIHIFEIGPAVELMAVSISEDAQSWISVGSFRGQPAGIDIDSVPGVNPDGRYRFVKIVDAGGEDGNTKYAGADIDAVAVTSSRSTCVRGVCCPQGGSCFADRVQSFVPGPSASSHQRVPENALGVPGQDAISLTDQGVLVLEFVDNTLSASGDDRKDLHVFEIGPWVEPMTIDISADGLSWVNLGTLKGQPTSIDIDAVEGVELGERYRFVRITDPTGGDRGGVHSGADIAGVAALSGVPAKAPLHAPMFFLFLGLTALQIGKNPR